MVTKNKKSILKTKLMRSLKMYCNRATGSGGSYLIEHILIKKSIKIFGFIDQRYFDDLKKYKNCKLIKINLLDYKNTKDKLIK